MDSSTESDAPRPLASWYTEGVSDGLGDRLLMFDNSGNASLELLRFRPELVAVSGFEEALRERAAQLRQLTDPAFPQVRAVEKLDRGGLALVSTFAAGRRLGEIFQQPRAGVHPTFAARLVRDLTAALAELQRQGDGIAHGGLTPERIVITPDGRLMIVEHVLGAALRRLRLPAERLWLDLGLIAPADRNGTARLDGRTDVIQLGWIVLSTLVGRRLSSGEYPRRAEALVDEFARAADPRSSALVAALRNWLERALQLDGETFGSAIEAQAALSERSLLGGSQAIAFVARRQAAELLAADAPQPALMESASPQVDPPAIGAAVAGSDKDLERPSDAEAPTRAAAADVIAELCERVRSAETPLIDPRGNRAERRIRLAWIAAAVLALAALGEAIALAFLVSTRDSAPKPAAMPVTFESPVAGDAVIVNGRQVGVTPLTLTLTPEVQSVRMQARSTVPDAGVHADISQQTPDRDAEAKAAAASAQAGPRLRRGGVHIVSPIEVQVLEGDRVLGSSVDGPIVTTTGRHEIDFINTALGYRSRHVVDIKPGKIAKMTVSPPDGRVSANAAPWAQVWINGTLAGDTPLANVPLPVGEHQITFRHPQLGEQTERVMVKSGALTRVTATFAR